MTIFSASHTLTAEEVSIQDTAMEFLSRQRTSYIVHTAYRVCSAHTAYCVQRTAPNV